MTFEDYFTSDEFKKLLASYEMWNVQGKATEYFEVDHFLDLVDYYQSKEDFDSALLATRRGLQMHPLDPMLTAYCVSLLVICKRYDEAGVVLEDLNPSQTDLYFYVMGQLRLARDNNIEEAENYFMQWVSLLYWLFKMGVEEDLKTGVEPVADFGKTKHMDLVIALEGAENFFPDDEFMDLDPVYLSLYKGDALYSEDAENGLDLPVTSDIVDRLREAYVRIICSLIELPKEVNRDKVYQWILRYVYQFGFSGNAPQDYIIISALDRVDFVKMEEKLLTYALNESPYLKDGWKMLASTQYRLGKTDAVINSADFALAINPDDYESKELKGICYFESGRYKEAAELYEQLNEKDVGWMYLIDLVKCYSKLNNFTGVERANDRLFFFVSQDLNQKLAGNGSIGADLEKTFCNILSEIADNYRGIFCPEKAIETLSFVVNTLSVPCNHFIYLKWMLQYYFNDNIERSSVMAYKVMEYCGHSLESLLQVAGALAVVLPNDVYAALLEAEQDALKSGKTVEELSKQYHINSWLASLSLIGCGDMQTVDKHVMDAFKYEGDYIMFHYGISMPDGGMTDAVKDDYINRTLRTIQKFKNEAKYNFSSRTNGHFC